MKRMMLIIAFAFMAIAGTAQAQVFVRVRPVIPPPLVVVGPMAPGQVWVAGRWGWNRRMNQRIWINGYWSTPHYGRARYGRYR